LPPKGRNDEMKVCFRITNWKREFEYLDMNKKWQKFSPVIEMAVQKFVPIAYVKIQKYLKWSTKKARIVGKYKFEMWTKY
jgi:hypothetical protein